MSVSSRALVEIILLGPTSDRRQLQDSPVLGDVWIAFAARPATPMDLLITPYKERSSGPLAVLIANRIEKRKQGQDAQVAYLQGLVVGRLFFREVVRFIVPMTQWWHYQDVQGYMKGSSKGRLRKAITAILNWVQAMDEDSRMELAEVFSSFTALDRYFSLASIILWAAVREGKAKSSGGIVRQLEKIKSPDVIVDEFWQILEETLKDPFPEGVQIWQVSLNRKALPALERSVAAVKGDAAKTLFNVKCEDIKWAVLDSGIDGTHPVFKDGDRNRIVKAFDFSNIRKIVSLDNQESRTAKQRIRELLLVSKNPPSGAEAVTILKALANDADNDRPILWELVEKFIEIDPTTPPPSGHGTHVAGIIGANGKPNAGEEQKYSDGMCPDIKLYDFRVLAKSVEDTEFAIIAALQYIRYLNERHSYMSIHGANLSLSIPHDVRNYACGRTPICNECERLVESGVVVVAAAGNFGYQSFETKEGSYEGYTAFSITDPGNADGVITVGATHRFRPHTYGVSFFLQPRSDR